MENNIKILYINYKYIFHNHFKLKVIYSFYCKSLNFHPPVNPIFLIFSKAFSFSSFLNGTIYLADSTYKSPKY